MSDGRTATILVNWNGAALTLDCLRSLAAAGVNMPDVYVVDNGSTDGSLAALQAAHTGAVILDAGRNGGFGAGNNVALRHTAGLGYEFVWFLNNDTTVEPSTLKELIAKLKTGNRIGGVGSVLRFSAPPHDIQALGGGWLEMLSGRAGPLRPGDRRTLSYVGGASMLVRTDVLQLVGGFDERFFMYWEDVDLSVRIANAGFQLAVAPASVVLHKESASSGVRSPRMDRMLNRSASIFFRKHSRFPLPPIVIGTAGRVVRRVIRGEWSRVGAVVFGALQGLIEPVDEDRTARFNPGAAGPLSP